MRRVKLTIAYDGTAYCGFQLQPNGVTIQSVMEEALGQLLQETVRLRPAGRTDAGVHAREQVVDFADSGRRPLATIVRGGNALLPRDIRILSAADAPPSFDAQRRAKSKEYRYFLYIAPVASPFLARYAWHLAGPVDLGAMREGFAHIVGKHDFSSFRGQGCTARTTVRKIHRVGIKAESLPCLFSLRVAGDGFLRYMVRNVVGTLVDIGRGKTPPDRMRDLLGLGKRSLAGPTAPPGGLFLWEVLYGQVEASGAAGRGDRNKGFFS
jgi:tRNA pseudouridine38-40 synthase